MRAALDAAVAPNGEAVMNDGTVDRVGIDSGSDIETGSDIDTSSDVASGPDIATGPETSPETGTSAGAGGLPEREAGGDAPVEVEYRIGDSPVGELLLAATPRGLVYIGFAVEDHQSVVEMLASRIGPTVLYSPDGPASSVLETAATQIDDYLSGRRREFDLPLDTLLATGFRGEVQRHLAQVGYGRTVSYRELATDLGRPGAVRAVGTACATNPLPLIWPCHRILRTDGGMGGYRGGLEVKSHLLAMESAA